MPGLTVECAADTEDAPLAQSLALSNADDRAHATDALMLQRESERDELITLAVIASLTVIVAAAVRALSWLGLGRAARVPACFIETADVRACGELERAGAEVEGA